MKRPTRDDVAQLAGVSGWTVSKVINGNLDSRISDETRGRVMDAVHQLGYRPNQTARALATGATHVIAVCADMRSPYSFKVINRFQSLFKEYGYRILIIDLDQALNSPQISLGPVDGFISLDSQEGIERFIQSNGNLHIPFVSMGVYYTEYRDHITIDIYNSSLQALKHLFDIGCKQIAYLQPQAPYPFAGDPRYDAYMNFTKNLYD